MRELENQNHSNLILLDFGPDELIRHIDLVYKIEEDDLQIYACRYHYDKK